MDLQQPFEHFLFQTLHAELGGPQFLLFGGELLFERAADALVILPAEIWRVFT